MASVLKIDSNQTELRYAEEETIGVLPTTPTWYQLDPNEYDDFGGEITTVARNPINSGRQRKKGVVVDLEASGGFTSDMTQDNLQDMMQGFLFATMRRKHELDVAIVDGSGNDYEPASGGADYKAGDLLFAKLFSNSANNGLKLVTGTPVAASVAVTDTGLVAETGAAGVISRVGVQFGSGDAAIDVSGALPKLVSTATAATATLDITGDAIADGNTVTVGGVVYTFESGTIDAGSPTAVEVLLGADDDASRANLEAAVNLTGTAGVTYSLNAVQNPIVSADDSVADTVVFTARSAGAQVNGSVASTTISGATLTDLAGGTGRGLNSLGLIVGEWVCLGSDTVGESFAETENNGLKRVRSISATEIEFDKSTLAMAVDAGAGKTIRMFFGRVLKNEVGTLVQRRSYQLERSLGAPDDAQPTQIQSEYLTGSIPNEFELEVTQAEITKASLSFMSREHETRTGVQGLKTGNRPTATDADAFNATSHVARISLAAIQDGVEAPADLFAFVMDLTLTINNNVSANKAVGFLGAFDNTAGTFEVDAEMNAYFQSVEAIQTVRDNADVTLDLTFLKDNQGMTFDLPLVSVGNARAEIEQDEPIMLPLENAAATGAKIDPELNHTLLVVFWDYIPTNAA